MQTNDSYLEKWSKGYSPLPIPPKEEVKIEPIKVAPIEVTDECKKKFDTRGYWVGPKVISDEDVKRLRHEIERVFTGEIDSATSPYEYKYWRQIVDKHRNKSKDVYKINNAWYINKTIRSLVLSKEIGAVAAKFLQTPEVRLWHDQVINKPGLGSIEAVKDHSGNIGWHQDYGFWCTSNTSNMCTAWIPLQDVGEDNGCLRTIVHSHKWGLLPDSATFFDKDMEKLKERFVAEGRGDWIDEPCSMKAGQVAFHHALTFHGSGPNITDQPRYAIAIHIMPQNCGYAPGNGWHHNIKDLGPDAKEGDLFAGPCFPVLYKAE
eukprot:TRINITY_DN10210_c0_g1_i4.p1 TRINITY_DN10210_c0_g1~~TRINITY_DN10210_c0_g1_i4.p1  ORF type:complete len:319 (-),score=58.44 TRINITY_DN10210_c0_g1_i4:12-968(-)